MNIAQLLTSQVLWSQKAFGPGFHPERVLKHIEKEIAEVRSQPSDVMEWVDIAILALDGAWRAAGGSNNLLAPRTARGIAQQVAVALFEKSLTNMHVRIWPKLHNDDAPVEHVRGEMTMIEAILFMHSHPGTVCADYGPGDNLWRFLDVEFYLYSPEERRWQAANPFCCEQFTFRVVAPSELEGLLCRDTDTTPDSPGTTP